jgi:hypothetical protein
VNVVFGSIAAALRKGEKVTLPIGTFEVLDRKRPPLRRWFLGRVRVTYAQRRNVKFTPPARGAWIETTIQRFLGRARVTYKQRKYIQFTPAEGVSGVRSGGRETDIRCMCRRRLRPSACLSYLRYMLHCSPSESKSAG